MATAFCTLPTSTTTVTRQSPAVATAANGPAMQLNTRCSIIAHPHPTAFGDTMRIAIRHLILAALLLAAVGPLRAAEPLKVAYSDWPGWVVFEIAIQKGWYKEAGVDVEFVWMEYGPSMEAFAAGKIDGVGMTNGDALVTGAAGKPATAVLITDYSDGNDMIIARAGITSMKQLKGKKIGVEVNLVDHLLLLKALEAAGMTEADVELVNIPTNDLPQAFAAGGDLAAIGCFQPSSGQALRAVPGSKAIFTSREVPGLIYDIMYASRESLAARRGDWQKFVAVWPRIYAFVADPATRPEALKIMSARVGLTPELYAPLLEGTKLLDIAGQKKAFLPGAGLDSVHGSTVISDNFNTKNKIYAAGAPGDLAGYFDAGLVGAVK